MYLSLEAIVIILFVLIVISISFILIIIYNKYANDVNHKLLVELFDYIGKDFLQANFKEKPEGRHKLLKQEKKFIQQYIEFRQISENKETNEKANTFFHLKKLDKKYIKKLYSKQKFQRIHASYVLGYFYSPLIVEELNKSLVNEKRLLVKLYIVEALSRHKIPNSIPYIISTLYHAPHWYKIKVFSLLACFERKLFAHLLTIMDSKIPEIEELIIHFAENYPDAALKDYLLEKAFYFKNYKSYRLTTPYFNDSPVSQQKIAKSGDPFSGELLIKIPTGDLNNIPVLSVTTLESIQIPEGVSLDTDEDILSKNPQISRPAQEFVMSLFNRYNYINLCNIIFGTIEIENIPEDLLLYVPLKKDEFLYKKFKLLTGNETLFNNILALFTDEFLSVRQKEIYKMVDEYILKRYLIYKENNRAQNNEQTTTLTYSENYEYELPDSFQMPHGASLDTNEDIISKHTDVSRPAQDYVMHLFNRNNYINLCNIVYGSIENEIIPLDFLLYIPSKKYEFLFKRFKLLTGNDTLFNNLMALFTDEFLSVKQKEICKIVDEFILKRYLFYKENKQAEKNELAAALALLKNYYYELNDDYFLNHHNLVIIKTAILGISKYPCTENIERLIPYLLRPEVRRNVVVGIFDMIKNKPEFTDYMITKFRNEQNQELKFAFAEILANRLEFFLQMLKFEYDDEKQRHIEMIDALIVNGLINNLISFLNINKDLFIENEVVSIIKKVFTPNRILRPIYITNTISFLEKNLDSELEKKIVQEAEERTEVQFNNVKSLIEFIQDNKDTEKGMLLHSDIRKGILTTEFGATLKTEIRDKLNIEKYKPIKPARVEKLEKDKVKFLQSIHVIIYLIFPALHTIRHFDIIVETPFWEQALFYLVILVFPIVYSTRYIKGLKKIKSFEYFALAGILMVFPILDFCQSREWIEITTFKTQADFFVLDFNFYLIFYSLMISFIYSGLLYLSFIGLHNQVNYASVQKSSFLFKDHILPSISIIAPAYAEEENIVESVNSQLNLRYPNYELIVVSDGSPDNTLKVLIDYFELHKIDAITEEKIPAQPIRGIYKNERNYPNLTVIDKINGGKADALNVGINTAKNDFFCGIDSDSLLEPDALIKLTSMMLNTEKESIAFGGNIFPINSCKVDRGKLESVQIPKESLAAFQTIEYLRAFMSGRIGWAQINSLLIISGAFGLFKTDRVIEMGGYLTGKSRYKKDTVGEDMELVVRLNRHMLEKKLPYTIHYCYNANCWTEVPELLKLQQIQKKKWKENFSTYISEVLYDDGFLTEQKMMEWRIKLLGLTHVNESMKILINQRDRWHRGLIDIINFHKDMLFNRKYKQIGLVSLPYFYIFEMVGPLIEFQGYVMVVFAYFLGLLNTKIALMLFISSIMFGIIISLASLMIAEKETNLYSAKEIRKLIIYALLENFGPRQIANYWRIKGFFNSMKAPKGWGQMLRKAKPIVVIGIANEDFRIRITKELEKIECKVIACSHGGSALQNIKKENLKTAILDEELSVQHPFNICKEIKTIPNKMNIQCAIISKNVGFIKGADEILKELDLVPIVSDNQDTMMDEIIYFVKQKIAL